MAGVQAQGFSGFPAASGPEAFPVRALRERILCIAGSASGVAAYLPQGLQRAPSGTSAAPAERAAAEPPVAPAAPRALAAPAAPAPAAAAPGAPPHAARARAPRGLPVAGRVRQLAAEPEGCREVQHALEAAEDEAARGGIALELRGHVAEAARSPYANFVLQKCVATMRPEAFQFIVDELVADMASGPARHKFACRVLQRVLERGSPAQLEAVGEPILTQIAELCRHPFGNYVVQHVLSHGLPSQQQRVLMEIAEDVSLLCRDPFGSNVVRAALAAHDAESRGRLARKIASDTKLVLDIAGARQGHTTVRLMVDALGVPERRELARAFESSTCLASSKYGRAVFHSLGLCLPKKAPVGLAQAAAGRAAALGGA